MPLRHIAKVRNALQGQLLIIVLLHIGDGLIDNEAAGVLAGLLFLRRLRQLIQAPHHLGKGLVDLIHPGGLQQKAGDPQADGLLGIAEIPVPGEHGHLHIRKLAAKPCQHGQSVLIRHADVGKQDVGPERTDRGGSRSCIIGHGGHLAVMLRPFHHTAKSFHDDIFIVDQYNPIHIPPPLFLNTPLSYTIFPGKINP